MAQRGKIENNDKNVMTKPPPGVAVLLHVPYFSFFFWLIIRVSRY